ncbi:MAG: 2Fe-2S iron-sulfur cluster binding domain-containing protein [Solobacterium sp.]|nr:2Fe-2S iron-sulfur cluster binding domain-containing protein [Solobacterium sp.]
MKVRGFIKDVGGASRVTAAREAKYESASAVPAPYDPIGKTAKLLHPGLIPLTVTKIKEASPTAVTIRFSADHIPYFKAGQYMTVQVKEGDSAASRPYSICSAPYETRTDHPFVEITVRKKKQNAFVSDILLEKTSVGDVFLCEVGLGEFHHDSIRDAHHITALAGGSGITPFVSMAKEITYGKLDADLTILYGSVNENDIILKEELDSLVSDRVKVIHVLSGDNPGWEGEKGFVNAQIIRKYAPEDTTFMICGPRPMHSFLKNELAKLNIPARRIRYDAPGQPQDISLSEGYPSGMKGKVFSLSVIQGISKTVIPASADESIASALERAGLKIHTSCRSGACGVCRIKVLSGEYYVNPENDGRRGADKDFNYVHSCSAYPLSDLTVKINI